MGRLKEIIKSKKYEIIYEAGRDPVTKKRKRKSVTFDGAKKQAELELARLELEFEKGHCLDVDNITFGEYCINWMETEGRNLAKATIRRYNQCINLRIIPWIGSIQLTKLRKLHLQRFYQKMVDEGCLPSGKPQGPRSPKKKEGEQPAKRPISRASLEYHHHVIHRILEAACEQEILYRNVANKIVLPETEIEPEDDKVEFLTPDEVKTLESRTPETPHFALCYFAVRTGMRRGEILGLRWSDVDLKTGDVTIVRALGHDGTYYKKPKNKFSKRTIKITKNVIDALSKVKAEQNLLKMRLGEQYDRKANLVFCQPDGRPWVPDTISSWFPDFCEKVGLRRFNFHCLRHTHASLLLSNGESLFFVSKRLGHSSIRTTSDLYGHLVPGKEADAIDRLEISLEN